MTTRLRWGLLAAGNIAAAFANGVRASKTGVLTAVASRSIEKANEFADRFDIAKRYSEYDDLLADPDIDAVYLSTPHPLHATWAVRTLDAGKHLLCEKPITLGFNDAQVIVEAAARNKRFLMEAFMYRCSAQTKRLVELLQNKAVGDVRLIRSTFGFNAGYNLESRLLNNALGGGGILDVGCYATSMTRLIAGAASGGTVAEPIKTVAVGRVGSESRCDEWTVASLEFPGGIVAQLSTSVRLNQDNAVEVFGDAGRIRVNSPWFCGGRDGGESEIIVTLNGKPSETIRVMNAPLYSEEADVVGNAINAGCLEAPFPSMTWADTLGNMKTLDAWKTAIGLKYDGESHAAYAEPIDRRPLRVRLNAKIPSGEIPGVGKPISKLVLGSMPCMTLPVAAVLYDEFFARGGNCIDTAHIYGGGKPEIALGEWLRTRGVRDAMTIIVKGAHPPNCSPDGMRRELDISLNDRLKIDCADIYFPHRDNPAIPVDEWIDALNELIDKGRIRAFGGSNWTPERIDAANAYAAKTGKRGFCAVSNNFSLARMVDPVWGGCISSAAPDIKRWHQKTQLPLFGWSSQARGFFVPGRAAPEKTDDKELVRCWYSDDNFKRLARVKKLADAKKTTTIAIALAWALAQPFPIWALIGPQTLEEMRTSFDALSVELTPDDVAVLNLEK